MENIFYPLRIRKVRVENRLFPSSGTVWQCISAFCYLPIFSFSLLHELFLVSFRPAPTSERHTDVDVGSTFEHGSPAACWPHVRAWPNFATLSICGCAGRYTAVKKRSAAPFSAGPCSSIDDVTSLPGQEQHPIDDTVAGLAEIRAHGALPC